MSSKNLPWCCIAFFDLFWLNLLLFVTGVSMLYYFAIVSWKDPGYIRPNSLGEGREIVLSLAQENLLNGRHYCSSCRIRKPLRSKHCKVCDRCVAKFDHHCPWLSTCIGEKNHFQFMLYNYSATIFIWTWILASLLLMWKFYDDITPANIADYQLSVKNHPPIFFHCPFPVHFCTLIQKHSFLFVCIVFSLLIKPVFITILTLLQTYQIAIGMTTNEFANYFRLEYFYPPIDEILERKSFNPKVGGVSVAADVNAMGDSLQQQELDVCLPEDPEGLNEYPLYKRPFQNPFDMGFLGNILNFFWSSRGSFVNINWYNLYRRPSSRNVRFSSSPSLAIV